jgi:hypothetical protein
MQKENQGAIKMKLLFVYALGLIVMSSACMSALEFSEIESIGEKTRDLGGPKVIYDFLAKPLADIPLPNHDATIYDAKSPTKRRLNVSLQALTRYEINAREGFNALDGFGTYAPLLISFDQELDVKDLWNRHNLHAIDEGKFRDDFRDDAVYLINVDPGCDRFGEEVALDIGRGRFPVTQYRKADAKYNDASPDQSYVKFRDLYMFSEFNPYAQYNNILFEERNEDLNDNGVLDEGEDLDFDGILDIANFIDPHVCDGMKGIDLDRCIADHLMTFYDRANHTLILRPVWPLEERCHYVAVLTKRLKGINGKSVESPFQSIYPQSHSADIERVLPFLNRYDLSINDIAFMWAFNTGTQTKDLIELRNGLYGEGVFANLKDQYPVNGFHLWQRSELVPNASLDQSQSLPGTCTGIALTQYWNIKGEWEANRCALEKENTGIASVFGGTFKAPDLLANKDTQVIDLHDQTYPFTATKRYPHTADERWLLDSHQGLIYQQEGEVTFWCALPIEKTKECSAGNPEGMPFCKPFPVILYAHGYGGSRAEIVSGHIGRTTSMGYAMCALDSYGHGLNILLEDNEVSRPIKLLFNILGRYGIPDLQELLMRGRDRDLTNDGLQDSGADMWTSDIFHTRDMVRQIALEYSQFIRILRSMDGKNKDQDGFLLGDIDRDGFVDLGGAQNTISMWGISLGGIISAVMAGLEPSLNAVSPNAGGAGLVDIATRSSQAGVPEAVLLPILGPFIVGCMPWDENQNPLKSGTGKGCFSKEEIPFDQMEVAFLVNQRASQAFIHFATLKGVSSGDLIALKNLKNGEVEKTKIDQRGRMMISVPSDALNALDKRIVLGIDENTNQSIRLDQPKDKDLIYALGDPWEITMTSSRSGEIQVLNRFEKDTSFQGVIYPQGAPLVALQEGFGLRRNSPKFRRFLSLAQTAIGPGDPAIWSQHIFLSPIQEYQNQPNQGGNTRVLQMPTAGDNQVPVNTGIAAARISGLFGSWFRDESKYPDPRFGWREIFQPVIQYPEEEGNLGIAKSIDQRLIDRFVVEGDGRLQRYRSSSNDPQIEFNVGEQAINPNVIFDIDNVSDGKALFSCGPSDWSAINGESGCPSEIEGMEVLFPVPFEKKPLRLNRPRDEKTFDAFRVPVLRPAGQHGIYNSQPFRLFDTDAFMVNFTTRFLGTRGQRVDHLEGCDCSIGALHEFEFNQSSIYPALGRGCVEEDLNLCSKECSVFWGFSQEKQISHCQVQ